MNRKNLTKLATYLEGLPLDYKHFDMWIFLATRDEEDEYDNWVTPPLDIMGKYARENGGIAQFPCGTSACALGHGPAAGVLVPEEMLIGDSVMWRVYGGLFVECNDWHNSEWEWCFSQEWAKYDNTARGAAARIRYLLDKGEAPECIEFCDPAEYEEYLHA